MVTEADMPQARSPIEIDLVPEERDELQRLVRSTTAASGLVQRAKAVLLFADEVPILEISHRLVLQRRIVKKWLRRFASKRVEGLKDAPRTGRPPVFPPRSRAPRRQDRVRTPRLSGSVALPVGQR